MQGVHGSRHEGVAPREPREVGGVRRELGTIAERPNDGRSPVANWGDPRLPEYIWARIVPEPTSGCWLWMGGVCPAGYGQINRQKPRLHRITYQSLIGLIPEGLH